MKGVIGNSYKLEQDGSFVIENYNKARPFSSFFPGIAGVNGIPMWVFYVNRGQGVATFGIRNKNYSILEFYAADKAYQLTQNLGFRTFVKVKKGNRRYVYEPFQNNAANNAFNTVQKMRIRAHELILEEENKTLGLKVTVRYFTIPGEPFAALGRTVDFTNTGKAGLELEVIDGLPKIVPFWMSEYTLKEMSTTHQAWAEITNFEKTGLPYYKLKVELGDSPEVTELEKGNFYFGMTGAGGKLKKADIIVDAELVFAEDTGFAYPFAFARAENYSLPRSQHGDNKYPSAMSFFRMSLGARGTGNFYSMIGHIASEQKLNSLFSRARSKEFFSAKAEQNKKIIDGITNQVYTKSGIKEFDLYCRQTYLDNILRGGMPVNLPAGESEIPYYVYWRKHGDLERDYNDFQVSPSYYSQGTANYRDVNQNRRSDVFFNPKVGDFNVLRFYNLTQLDGYNPLIVEGTFFAVDKPNSRVTDLVDPEDRERALKFIAKPFEPGSLLLFLEENRIGLKVTKQEFLREVLGISRRIEETRFHEGFWTDHWMYNLDLLESYLAVFPEKEKELLLERKEFTYFDNDHMVVPRSHKYVDAGNGKIRQFGSVSADRRKAELMKFRKSDSNKVRAQNGKGGVYLTTLAAKLICLTANKFATLDSEGIGIEAEANKPSWYDALNGLPGVFGSCTPETFELKRMCVFLRERLGAHNLDPDYGISVHEELFVFITGLEKLLKASKNMSGFAFWDKASSLKEEYRKSVFFGVSGREQEITVGKLESFLALALKKIDKGIRKAYDPKTGLYHTYLSYSAKKYRNTNRISHKGQKCVDVSAFAKRPLPLFLEGQVHYIKTEKDINKIRALHIAVKKSGLYDNVLKMYKVNASLKNEPYDIGRCTVFNPGWLENESIWLHMEYKYLLELLKAGLYREFFGEFKKAGVCFLDPETYGRSILENSSFIASSAFPDRNQWGRGFVARLSGSTAEFVEMWLCMTAGRRPFRLDAAGELLLEFKPALPKEYFDGSGRFEFMFLNKTVVTYVNKRGIDTFSNSFGVEKIVIEWTDGKKSAIEGNVITGVLAHRVRAREAKKIEVYF
jgi:hypothetical protein